MAFTTYDNAPYLYRRSGGGGDKEIDKLVGGTIAWNQLFQSEANGVNSNAGTKTYDSTTNTFTVTNSTSVSWLGVYTLRANILSTPNHKYLIFVKATNTLATNLRFGTDTSYKVQSGFTANTEKVCTAVINPTTSDSFIFYFNNASSVKFRDIQIFDLTLMFGSTIADYVYSLEQSSQGSGLAWLRSYGFFTEDYYDYNAGELKSVSNLVSHDMTGKNLLGKSSTNVGSITVSGITFTFEDDGSVTLNGTATETIYPVLWSGDNRSVAQNAGWAADSKGFVLPSGNYYWNARRSGTSSRIPIMVLGIKTLGTSTGTVQYANTSVTIDSKTQALSHVYVGVVVGDVYSNYNIKWQLEFGSTATSYEPYTLRSYPLGDVTLRGLPKLNGNALYYDGDTYESNGTVTRRYIALTVNGSESWGKEADGWMSAQGVNSFYLSLQSAIQPNYIDGTIAANATSNRLLVATYRDYRSGIAQPNWFTFTGGGAYIDISSTLSTVDEFKAWLQSNPVTVVYELKTPTTETADTYTNPQWVDPNGTERYTLSSNAFPMPVGHETTYNTDMGSKTVNTQVNLSMTEPSVRQVYAKEGDTARVLNIHLDQTEEDGTLRILRPDGTEVTADAVLVPEFYDGLMAEIPSDATSIVGKCYCDVEQNGVSSMPFTLNVKKNERQ